MGGRQDLPLSLPFTVDYAYDNDSENEYDSDNEKYPPQESIARHGISVAHADVLALVLVATLDDSVVRAAVTRTVCVAVADLPRA